MQTTLGDWKAIRTIHLSGGCRPFNGLNQIVEFQPHALNGQFAHFETRAYGAIFADLESLGLTIIGVDFVTHLNEVKGIYPPEWRAYHASNNTCWPCTDEAQRWSQIGHAAFTREQGQFWDTASRISHQLRVCEWRLRQISDAYHDQLIARIKADKFTVGGRFEDGYTWQAYLAIQFFLVDACVLRDYLAEFYGRFVCQDKALLDGNLITTMGSLKRKVLDKTACDDVVTKTLKDATVEGGWLFELGAYRDLVVHSAPLAKARNRLFATSHELHITDHGSLPAVRLPIPMNPNAVSKSRATGEHFEDFTRQLDRFAEAASADTTSSDGLLYAHEALRKLTRMARQLGELSPLAAEVPHIGPDDIIGPVRFTRA